MPELFGFGQRRLQGLGARIAGLAIGLIAFNLLIWAWTFAAFREHPLLLGTALLAYAFGLRHAVDADHIAAIDNVTRKLIQGSKRPISVGLFFSLGHSTVVILTSAAIAVTSTTLQSKFASFREVGSLVGTGVSALFLMAIALANVGILITTCQALSAATRGQSGLEDRLAALPSPRGMLGACLQPLFKLISASWHMYPLGFLFGLGFDTATEIGVLGISAAQGATALPLWSIMVFPALFTAGMSLVDTLDGILIVGAYGWALVKPVRKLYYNLTVTLLSVLLAVLIGGAEALELLVQGLHLEATFASFSTAIANNSGMLGYLIVGTFVASWLLSLGIYRLNVDKIR